MGQGWGWGVRKFLIISLVMLATPSLTLILALILALTLALTLPLTLTQKLR